MKLLEAILEANARGNGKADPPINVQAFAASLPLVVLGCVDPRLTRKQPEALGLPDDQVVWLRTPGNLITDPMDGTMRSVALACLVKRAREMVVIGHTDCGVANNNALTLTETMKELGVDRQRLPENLEEFFGLFSNERQNVARTVAVIRQSPLLSPRMPVHGLLIHVDTGRLEWVVNGYQGLATLPGS